MILYPSFFIFPFHFIFCVTLTTLLIIFLISYCIFYLISTKLALLLILPVCSFSRDATLVLVEAVLPLNVLLILGRFWSLDPTLFDDHFQTLEGKSD